MDRRAALVLVGMALALPRKALAQAAKRIHRIAILDDAVESARAANWRLFRQRLGELGLV